MKSQHETRTVKTATALLLTVMLLFFGRKPLPASAAPPTATDASLLLVEGLTNCKESIDLRDASLPVSELGRLYQKVLLDHPELFHVAPRLSCSYTETVTDGIPARTVTAAAFEISTEGNIPLGEELGEIGLTGLCIYSVTPIQ